MSSGESVGKRRCPRLVVAIIAVLLGMALGFSAHQIKMHYLSYAIAPSAVGAVLGTLIGHNTLPFLLWDTLIAQNEMPYRLTPPISAFAWLRKGKPNFSFMYSSFCLIMAGTISS